MKQKRFKFVWITLLLLGTTSTPIQAQDLSFKAGDRVCFVGNSITHSGYYWSYIVLYYATRFPDRHISFFNCGISGDTADGILRRMDYDVLSNDPTVATVMIGMNDVRRNSYRTERMANEEEHKKTVAATLASYERNTTKIDQILSEKVRELILFTPSIYDQTSTAATPNLIGVNDGLCTFGELIKREAPKYKAHVVDFWAGMSQVNASLQQQNPEASIIGKDRVHPEAGGGLVMAYQFLKDTRLPQIVSTVSIDVNKRHSETQNGTLSNLSIDRKRISFDFLAKSLPFPTTESMGKFITLYPFQEEFNQEKLTVRGLAEGSYELTIEGKIVGQYSSKELEKGLNLAINNQTPQYKQAVQVMQTVEKFRNRYASYRGLLLIEHARLKDYRHIQNVDSCIARVSELYEKESNKNTYMPQQYKFYIENKKQQQKIWNEVRELNKTIYRNNQPAKINYRLVKTNLKTDL